jgi:hypothetical protein
MPSLLSEVYVFFCDSYDPAIMPTHSLPFSVRLTTTFFSTLCFATPPALYFSCCLQCPPSCAPPLLPPSPRRLQPTCPSHARRYKREDSVSVQVKVTVPPPAPDSAHSMSPEPVHAESQQTRYI